MIILVTHRLLPWIRRHTFISFLVLFFSILFIFWIFKLISLHAQIETYRQYWSTPRGEPGGIVYVALGDSAAQGIGASSPERGYVQVVAKEVATRSNTPVQIINLSKSGARLKDVLEEQIPKMKTYKPDLVTVSIGANNIPAYHEDQFEKKMNAICKLLPEKSIIATIPYFMHGQANIDAIQASGVVRTCARQNNLIVAPLYASMEQRGWKAMFTDYAADWFHPNDRGYKVWADAFVEVLPEAGY